MPQPQVYEKLFSQVQTLGSTVFRNPRLAAGGVVGLTAWVIISRYLFNSQAKLVTDYAQVARQLISNEYNFDEYDVIIVGGGTAGCVLASRLTEDPSIRVLLIEAGESGRKNPNISMPAGYGVNLHSNIDYQFYTIPQTHAGNKKKYLPRGKVLGGSSAINAQIAQYGAPSDFDEWAAITGDSSLSWTEFSKYFRKFEKYTPDQRFPFVDSSQRGSSGPVEVGYHSYAWPGGELFVKAAINAGIPFNPDFTTTDGTKGVNRIMTYIDNRGRRVTTETAYLTDAVLARSNLKVVTQARVTKILVEGRTDGAPQATGVEFASSPDGPRFRARARKEVIVCGGSIHSPQILMLSGIGPADHLKQHNVPVLHDLPGVGANLVDHVFMYYRLMETSGKTMNYLVPWNIWTTARSLLALFQYKINGKGPLSSNIGETAAFLRSDDPVLFPPHEYPNKIEDATSGPESPDIELVSASMAIVNHSEIIEPHAHSFSNLAILLRPTSVGTLRLASADPWADPLIDPNVCQTQHDVDVLVRALRAGFKIAHTEPLRSIVDVESNHPTADHDFARMNDEELGQIVRERVELAYHPTGTCRMAPLEKGGVVDTEMKVYGVRNLRVCDVSAFPKLISGHTAGACIALAEKFADMLKAEFRSELQAA